MEKFTVGIFNDSFPPIMDGVANAALNYADIINKKYGRAIVATPYYPDAADNYPFEVLRYPSAYLGDSIGYRAGYPFDLKLLGELEKRKLDIIHTHSPFTSAILARVVRNMAEAPIVFTYHTKFNIDFEKAISNDALRKISTRFILNNIKSCDEIWTVSKGAGENLKSIGYDGDYIVMKNGVDFERRRSDKERVDALKKELGIPKRTPVFLYVGRMMWYKGLKLSLEGLKAAKDEGVDFRFVLVGDGRDAAEIKEYAVSKGLSARCIFAGAVMERELLRDYYSMSDLFLFPSTFDTNGIVVREAAACGVPSLTIRGTCAAEDIENKETGLLINNDVCSMRDAVIFACNNRAALRKIGKNAERELYYSWDDAVEKAFARYLTVIDNFRYKINGAERRTKTDFGTDKDQRTTFGSS